MNDVKRYFIDGEDCFTVESENGDLVDYHDFDLLSQKLEQVGKESLEINGRLLTENEKLSVKLELAMNCLNNISDNNNEEIALQLSEWAREVIQKIEAL